MCDEKEQAIVLDNGSGMSKAGFAGYNAPAYVFPSVVGFWRYPGLQNLYPALEQKYSFVGYEAQSRSKILELVYPIEHGIVTNWYAMEKLWKYTFEILEIKQDSSKPILLTEPHFNNTNREKMTEMMFETFNTPSLYITSPAVLSLYSSNRTTGVVLECGDGLTQAVPIYEGEAIHHGIVKGRMAGRDVSNCLMQMLKKDRSDMEISNITAQDMKEKLCYATLDFEQEMKTATISDSMDRSYELPDKQVITIREERFKCVEVLFNPVVARETELNIPIQQIQGVQEILHDATMRCPEEIRKELYANILLSGGTTLVPGFADRLKKDLSALVPSTMEINISQCKKEENSFTCNPWLGGSILAILTSQKMWISKQEYDEFGASIVHRKCF